MSVSSVQVSISGEWVPWSAKVPQMEVETHKVASPDIVVPTLDTVRHEALLYTWLADHKPMGESWSYGSLFGGVQFYDFYKLGHFRYQTRVQ